MLHQDSLGTEIFVGDQIRFRSRQYTIKSFVEGEGKYGTAQIEFKEEQHVSEIADEISVDFVSGVR